MGANLTTPRFVFWITLFLPLLRILGPLLMLYVRLTWPEYHRYLNLDRPAWRAYDKGDLSRAEALANGCLGLTGRPERDWNYGNAVHEAHQVLGLVCLARGGDAEGRRGTCGRPGTRPARRGSTPAAPACG